MYVFVTVDKITQFFQHFNIDISLMSNEYLSIVVVLCNILVLLFYFFVFFVLYKLVFLVKDSWF